MVSHWTTRRNRPIQNDNVLASVDGYGKGPGVIRGLVICSGFTSGDLNEWAN